MLKTSIVCAFSVFLLIVSVNGDFSGFKTKSTGSNAPEEPSVNVEQGTSEGSSDDNDKGDVTPQVDTRLEDDDAVDPLDNGKNKGGQENNEKENVTICGSPPEVEEAMTPDLDDTEHAVGTEIKYQCNLGYVSQFSGGFPSVCKINKKTKKAEWTEPEISCSPRSCGDPGYVTNGRRIGNLFTFPNKVEFECDEGYKLKGLKSRYCQARGEWSGRRLPTCELIYCSEPANPVNGRVSYTSLGYGSELQYECNKGFVLKKHVTKVCGGDGKWSKEEPDCIEVTCEKPLQPERGSVQFSDGQAVGSLATYSCEEGTTLVGVSLVKCLDEGIWTFDPPKCLRSCKIPEIGNGTTGFLKTVQRNRRNYQEFAQFQVGETVKHHETVTVRCNEGFIPVNLTTLPNGDNYALCKDGVWSRSMQCAPSKCLGDVPYLENGTPVIPNHLNGSVMWYRCKDGFERLKKGHVECIYGTWKGQPPVCGDIRCSTNGINYPGLKLPKEVYFISGRSFEINCEDGYEKTSSEMKIECLKGTWKIESNPCTIRDQNSDLQCPELPQITEKGDFVIIYENDRKIHSVARYECQDDTYVLIGNESRVCMENGQWSGTLPSCGEPKIQCPYLPSRTERGTFVITYVNDLKVSSTAYYSCQDRTQKLIGGRQRTCLDNGKWSGREPSCEDSNGCNRNEFFLCNNGRCIPKNERCDGYNSCGDNSDEERCGNSKCEEEPPGIQNGRIAYFDRKHGSKVEYQCDESFVMERESSVFCNVDKWKGDPPLCQKSKCEEEPPRIQNGKVDFFEREHGSEVRYRCDEYFEILRESSVVCNVDKWEGDPPQCQEIGQIHNLEIKPEQQNNLYREKHSTTTEVPRSTSSSVASDTCYCTFDYLDDSVRAYSGSRPVDVRSVIRKGETVSLFCQQAEMGIVWTNGLSFYRNTVTLTCDTCKNWTRDDLPHCRARHEADSLLLFNNHMKILPGGIVEIPRHKSITFHCINFFAQPAWNPSDIIGTHVSTTRNNQHYTTFLNINVAMDSHAGRYVCYFPTTYNGYRPTTLILKIAEPEIQCPPLEKNTNRGIFHIHYENNRKVHSVANYACVSRFQKLIGPTSRECMENGKWSGSYPSCEDITCPWFLTYNSLVVAYTKDNKVNSRAAFSCGRNAQLIGKNWAVCMPSGQWSNQSPTCENYVSCNMFEESENVDVFYSNDIKVGSTATFTCVSPYTLVGNHQARCLRNGTWSSDLPSCETPKCSVDRLFDRLPQEVAPDLRNVTDDYVPYGSELQFVCGPNSFLSGSSKTKCGSQGRWEHGDVRCSEGCTLGEITSTSQLLVETVKDYYLFGEAITFSCPTGQKLSSEIQRVMCLGKSWSDPIPDCEAAPQANPSNRKK